MDSDNIQDFKDLIQKLNERNKELNCLYKADDILKDYNSNFNETIYKIIDIIPSGLQFPDICKVKIIIDEDEFTSSEFKRTELKLSTPILSNNKKLGEIQAYYIKPVKLERKRIFLPEEFKLISTIADKIANYISYRNLLNSVKNNSSHSNEEDQNSIYNWFKQMGLSKDEVDQITTNEVNFKKGEKIVKAGALSTYCVIISSGYSKSYIDGNQGRNFIYKINQPYEILGLSSIYGRNNFHYSVTALTNCSIYITDSEILKRIISSNKDFSINVMKRYCIHTELLFNRLSCISNKQAIGKIADVLLYLSNNIFKSSFIPSVITRKDISDMAAMSNEGAVRILSEFKNDNLINYINNGIEIINFEKIKALSIAG